MFFTYSILKAALACAWNTDLNYLRFNGDCDVAHISSHSRNHVFSRISSCYVIVHWFPTSILVARVSSTDMCCVESILVSIFSVCIDTVSWKVWNCPSFAVDGQLTTRFVRDLVNTIHGHRCNNLGKHLYVINKLVSLCLEYILLCLMWHN